MSELDIDPTEWAQLDRLLEEALELPPAERERWLGTLPPEREHLKPRLRRLLDEAARCEGGDPLQSLPTLELGEGGAGRADERTSEVIGPYRLVRPLGEGGMGSVWLAERTDGLLSRAVALKLPRASWRPGLAERMAREREILGSLEHAHIARLYDAGLGADGQPYLALEYVDGRSIDVYARDERLDLRGRLRLFLQVAEAVAHAHARLVIHRDLKPGNILVTGDGQVRLLDFGIAKLLDQGRAEETELTRLGGRALTPAYASPEQIEGGPLGVASDVYSLGVVLYELVAGVRPYQPERETPAAYEEAVLRTDPARPSTVASEPRLARALRGDLDTIVLKALKKKPSERYATVNALAEDLQRHLDGRPVLARPDRALYRLRKFVGRNRLLVGTSAAVMISVVAGASVAYWQARTAAIAGRRAEEVKNFIVSIFQNADPNRGAGEALSAVELLRQARSRLDASRIEDPALRLELLNTLGESMLGLDDAQAAVPVLKVAVDLAAASGIDNAQSLRARRLHAKGAATLGQETQALAALEAVVARLRSEPGRHPEELVAALLDKARVENVAGRNEQAERTAREALEASRTLLGGKRPESVNALIQMSEAADYLRQSDRAFAAARDAYTLAKEVYGPNEAHPVVNAARTQYGVALADQDRIEEALDLMRASARDAARLFGADSRIVGNHAAALVQYLGMGGRVKEALASSDASMRILEPLVEPDSLQHGGLLDMRGLALMGVRRPAEALLATSRAREIVRKHLGGGHESVFVLTVHRGRQLALLGRLDEARRELQWVVDHYGKTGRATMSTPLHQLGFATRLQGRAAEAVALQERALAAVRPGPRARRSSARILAELGLARLDAGDAAGARAALGEARAIYEEKFPARTPEYADVMIGLGRLALAEGKAAEAARCFEVADAYWKELDAESPWAAEAASWLGRARAAPGR